ncbi:MAG: carbamoyl-phosphate synthase small subunit [Bdellovibrio sp.]|nr:MAG: carbamoyl-phosphate synthase small subunit [Bdellovibrio sp.]
MKSPAAYLVLESGKTFSGWWMGGQEKAGEVVFNTSHSGYEEMATDPSYYSQILVLTAPMQGNYGVSSEVWESRKIWIHGFVCVEIQNNSYDSEWQDRLEQYQVPVVAGLDTRSLVLHLREQGTTWGALVKAGSEEEACEKAEVLIKEQKKQDKDWVYQVTSRKVVDIIGDEARGPRVAILDFGSKKNILRELKKRCSALRIFPSRSSASEIKAWQPHGIMLTNGPGDPENVQVAQDTVRELLGWRFIFGICMGHQILSLALGAKTYKLKYGHRGSNHPIEDKLLSRIYMTSQNHGYAVRKESLPPDVQLTHVNLNDQTVAGIFSEEKKCLGVQFHPESHPGPHESVELFDYFIKRLM